MTAGTSGVGVINSGTSSVTITGTIAQINDLLGANATSTVSYINNSDTPGASTILTLTLNDNGNSGSGGPLNRSDTATIDITPVNDAPLASAPLAHYTATEQTNLQLAGTGLQVSDIDGNDGVETVTLSVGEGTITVSPGANVVTIVGNGSSSVTISSPVLGGNSFVNALLFGNNGGSIIFNANTDAPSANTTLTLTINDNGNTGGGDLSANATAIIDITAVNDAPTGAPTAVLADGTEDASYTVSAADLLAGFSDVDLDALLVANLGASNGSMVDNLDGTFTITPTANFNGLVTLTYDVSDGNGGSVAGVTRTYSLGAVNDAPVTSDGSILTEPDMSVQIALAGSDVDGTVASFRVTSALPAGTFWDAETGGVQLDPDALPGSGSIWFRPTGGFSGTTSLQFAAIDDLGLQDASPATFTITVVGETQTTTNPDGSSTVVYTDVHDLFAWLTTTVHYDSQARMTDQTVNYDDGARAEHVWDVQEQFNWLDYILTYDSQNRLTSQLFYYDDGSRTTASYDVAGQFNYADSLVSYDGQDRLTEQSVHYDDGSRASAIYDPGDAFDWSDIASNHDTQHRLTDQTVHYDDGSRALVSYDAGSQFDWIDILTNHDSLNRLTDQTVHYDDGTRVAASYDAAEQFNWTSSFVNYDDLNRVTGETVYYDDGSRRVVGNDAADQFGWLDSAVDYDSLNQLTGQTVHYDDGSYTIVLYDPANQVNWQDDLFTYDSLGGLTAQNLHFDDNTRAVYAYDPQDQAPWSWLVSYYDALGAFVSQDGTYDDGTTWHI